MLFQSEIYDSPTQIAQIAEVAGADRVHPDAVSATTPGESRRHHRDQHHDGEGHRAAGWADTRDRSREERRADHAHGYDRQHDWKQTNPRVHRRGPGERGAA